MIINKNIANFVGMEIGFFKLKPDASETQVIELSQALEQGLLAQQTELLGHFLLKGKDGCYADITMASTQEKAEQYCQQWLNDPQALAYLELIEPESVDMTFWSRIN